MYKILLALLLSLAATTTCAANEDDDEAGLLGPKTVYHPLDPPFVVNLKGAGKHFLRANIQVMAKGEDVIDDVKKHQAMIRHELILLLSDQELDIIASPDGREHLRQDALQVIQDSLRSTTGRPGVKAVYFTTFVTQ